jgi:zinc transporter, ZIP family
MIDFFENLPPYLQALIAGIITWLLTALGAASVFIFKTVNKKILTSMQGFAAGATRFKAFNYGQASAIVEPIFATIGAIAIIFITPVLPYALAFAAGAMIFVVVEELIPDSQSGNNTDLATLSLMLGFVIMMILDVSLG